VSINTVRIKLNGRRVASLLEPIDAAAVSATALVVYTAAMSLGISKSTKSSVGCSVVIDLPAEFCQFHLIVATIPMDKGDMFPQCLP